MINKFLPSLFEEELFSLIEGTGNFGNSLLFLLLNRGKLFLFNILLLSLVFSLIIAGCDNLSLPNRTFLALWRKETFIILDG